MNKLHLLAAALGFALLACGDQNLPDYFNSSDSLTSSSAPRVTIGSPSTKLIRTGKVTYKVTYTNAYKVNLTAAKVTVKTVGNVSYTKTVTGGTSKAPVITLTIKSGTGRIDSIAIAKGTSTNKLKKPDVGTSNATDVIVDNTVPTIAIDEPLANIGSGNFSLYGLSGSCSENGKTVSLISPVTASTTCSSGVFSFSNLDLSGVTDGTVTFTAKIVDSAGNQASASADAFKDVAVPTVSVGAPSISNINTGDIDYEVTYTGASTINLVAVAHVQVDATGTVTFTKSVINGTTANPTIRITITGGDGTIDAITLVAGSSQDSVGNLDTGTSSNNPVTVDNTAPTVSIGSPSVSAISTGNVDYAVVYSGASSINLLAANVTVNVTGSVAYTKSVIGGTTANPTIRVALTSGDGTIDSISIDGGTSSDAAGNLDAGASQGADVTVDNTAPTVSIGAPSLSSTSNGNVNYAVTYTGASNIGLSSSHVTVHTTGTVTYTKSVSGGLTSTPTIQISITGGDGTIDSISINGGTSSDAVGNLDAGASQGADVTVDNTAPTVSIGSPSVSSINTGNIDYPVTYTGATTINLVANAHVIPSVSGTVTFSKSVLNGTTANPTIRITITGGDGTVDGISLVAGSSQDSVGNLDTGTSSNNTVTVDNTAPTVSLGLMTIINNANQNAYSISGACSENGDTITITAPSAVNGTTTTCAAGAFSFSNLNVSSIPDGSINFTVQIADAHSNLGTDTESATKDATPPSISSLALYSPATSPGNDTTPDIQVSGTFPIGDTFELFSDATCTTSRSSAVAATGANSIVITSNSLSTNTTYTYFAKGTDAAGNTSCSGAGVSVSYVLDTVNPTITISTSTAISNANKTNYTISGTCSENGRTVNLTSPISSTVTCSSNAFSFTGLNVSGASDGTVSLAVNISDAAGNSGSNSRNVTKDTVNPTVTITSLPNITTGNYTTYTIMGACTANGDTISVSSPGGISGSTTCAGGSYTLSNLNVSGLSDSASISFTIRGQDAVGNIGTASSNAMKDVTPPSDPSCDSLNGDATPTKTDTVNWSGSSDNVSGIGHYEMRVYRPRTDAVIVDWTNIGVDVNPYRFSGLSSPKLMFNDEAHEEYPVAYVTYIRAVDNFSNYSNEVTCPEWHLKPAYGNFQGITTKNKNDPTMFNDKDPYELLFTTEKFNSSYFNHETVKNPEKITIMEPGNYLLAFNQPMYRKNGNNEARIASAKTIIKINGNETENGISANSLSWGLQNDGHDENPLFTNNHMTVLLQNLSEGDIVTVESVNNADETEKLIRIEENPFTAYLEFIPEEQSKINLLAESTDLGSDLNAGDGKVQWWSSIDEGESISFDGGDPSKINFTDDGDYFLAFNLPLERIDGDGNQKIEAHIFINGDEIRNDNALFAGNDLISNQNNHTMSSANYSTLMQNIKRGDSLEVVLRRVGNSGTITIPHHKPMSMFIYKAPHTSVKNIMLSGENHDWIDGGEVNWIKDYITDTETYEYKNQNITVKRNGDYLAILNVDLDIDTDYAKPIFFLTKNGENIPGATCTNANMTINPGEARKANCVIELLIENIKENDVIRFNSMMDIRDAVANSYSAPKIHLRKVSESE